MTATLYLISIDYITW